MLPFFLLLATGVDLSLPRGWKGTGFAFKAGLATSEATGLLHRTFDLPGDATLIEFQAAAERPDGLLPQGVLDVVLEASGREYLPRLALVSGKWVSSKQILPPLAGKPRVYAWKVGKFAGRRLRIALMDGDARPNCRLVAGRFKIVGRDDRNARRFAYDLAALARRHKLGKSRRSDSRHFMAMGNAGAAFVERRLDDCEKIYPEFFTHFRKRGFAVKEPAEKMMVAVFRTQAGFAAYLGQNLGPSVTGVYHPESNRLVLYDYATNSSFIAARKGAEAALGRTESDAARLGQSVKFGRLLRDRRDDVNVSTTMHEVAHQLSFNGGLLNRDGDVPAWLAEGLAVYCESAINGAWQGIGEPNPRRARLLAIGAGKLFALRRLVANDDWLRKSSSVERVVLGYSQSWLLFRLLMEEEPKQLKAYLETIRSRKGAESRLTDFVEAFGDLKKLEARYAAFAAQVARKEGR